MDLRYIWKSVELQICLKSCQNILYLHEDLCMIGDRGGTVVKVLCYKLEGRWFDPIKSFRSHYDHGVNSASNRNEYQEHFLGVKSAGA